MPKASNDTLSMWIDLEQNTNIRINRIKLGISGWGGALKAIRLSGISGDGWFSFFMSEVLMNGSNLIVSSLQCKSMVYESSNIKKCSYSMGYSNMLYFLFIQWFELTLL